MKMTVSAKEAAQIVGISYWLLLEMAKRNEVPHIRAGKRVLFRLESLEKWMDEQEQHSVSQHDNNNEFRKVRKIDF